MKISKKALSVVLALTIVLSAMIGIIEYFPSFAAESSDPSPLKTDDAYISNFTVTKVADGRPEWDSDDNPGNDSGPDNNICRTFDVIEYKMSASVQTYSNKAYSSARMFFEFVLPVSETKADFDTGVMSWLDESEEYHWTETKETRSIQNPKTLEYEDVECQVLKGSFLMQKSITATNAIPGDILDKPVVVRIKNAINGDIVQPIFSAAMDYNTWSDEACSKSNHGIEKKTVIGDPITVSAKMNINIYVGNNDKSFKETYDFNTGHDPAKYPDSPAANYGIGKVYGRRFQLYFDIELFGDNITKGYKGMEVPSGPIQFAVKVQTLINDEDVTDDFCPLLWEYDGFNTLRNGRSGRTQLGFYEYYGQKGGVYNGYSYNQNKSQSVYDGGTWYAYQEGDTIYFTVKDYDIEWGCFPTRKFKDNDTYGWDIEANRGKISSGKIAIIQPYNLPGNTSVYAPYDIQNSNTELNRVDTKFTVTEVKAQSVSGQNYVPYDVTNPTNVPIIDGCTADNTRTRTDSISQGGTFSQTVFYSTFKNRYSGDVIDTSGVSGRINFGDDIAVPGQTIVACVHNAYTANGEEALKYALITTVYKIDTTGYNFTGENYLNADANTKEFKVYYGTKKDGTAWVDETEQEKTLIPELVYYETFEEAKAHGVVLACLTVKYEQSVTAASQCGIRESIGLKVNNDPDIVGNTYEVIANSRLYTYQQLHEANLTIDDIKSMGWTDPDNFPLNSLPTPYKRSFDPENKWGQYNYYKTEYTPNVSGYTTSHRNVNGSTGRFLGDTLLIVDAVTKIAKHFDQTIKGEEKTTYNLEQQQRYIDFSLNPYFYADGLPTGVDTTTEVYITDTLPEYLTYIPGSSYFGGTYKQTSELGGTQGKIVDGQKHEPDIIYTDPSTGFTTLYWVFEDVKITDKLPQIHYSTYIGLYDETPGKKEVPFNSTEHKVNTVYITTPEDNRKTNDITVGNYSEARFDIVQGKTRGFYKRILDTNWRLPDLTASQNKAFSDITYELNYSNNGNTDAALCMIDMLPYNGDKNGTNYTGFYLVSELNTKVLGLSSAETNNFSNIEFYYTLDTSYRGQESISASTIKANWTKGYIDSATGKVYGIDGLQPVAFAYVGTLKPSQTLKANLKVSIFPFDLDATNEYHNSGMNENTVVVTDSKMITTELKGLAWDDVNRNGLQDADESKMNGVKVTLLKLKENGDPTKESDYEVCYSQMPVLTSLPESTIKKLFGLAQSSELITAYQNAVSLNDYKAVEEAIYKTLTPSEIEDLLNDFDFEPTPITVMTGKTCNALTGEITDGADGKYTFRHLDGGTYAVRFEDGTTSIQNLVATTPNVTGEDNYDEIDSDAIAIIENNKLSKSVIYNIDMPSLAELHDTANDDQTYVNDYNDAGFYQSFSFEFTKIQGNNINKPLEGATFAIYPCLHTHNANCGGLTGTCSVYESLLTSNDFNTSLWDFENALAESTSDENGLVKFDNINVGYYVLVELSTADDYELSRGCWIISVDTNNGVVIKANNFSPTTNEGMPNAFIKKTENDADVYYLPNYKKPILPIAGSTGIEIFLLVGTAFMAISCAFLYSTSKKRKYTV